MKAGNQIAHLSGNILRGPDGPGGTAPSASSADEPAEIASAVDAHVMPRWRLVDLVRHVPTVIVLGVLVAIGYWGHSHGWDIPKFSDLSGKRLEGGADWCEAHSVPGAICIACNANLMPKAELHGWCDEHGVAECVLHHPEISQLANVPEVPPADLAQVATALALRPRPKNDRSCKMHLRRIQFVDKDAVQKAGIDIRLAERSTITETVIANGEVTYDPTRVARVASRTPGTVWRVEKNIGDRVVEGDLLALVDSADVGRTKAELLQAMAELELANKAHGRLAGLGDIVPGRRLQEVEAEQAKANAAVGKSIQALINLGLPVSPASISNKSGLQLSREIQFLGLPHDLTSELDPDRTTGNLALLVAPRSGVVVQRNVVAGEVVDPSKTLFTVVDNSSMWLMIDVSMEDFQYVRVGQQVIFRPDGATDYHPGTVTWTSTEMDRETRTVTLRAELINQDGRLLSKTFGASKVVLRETPRATVVPEEAVHWEGCCHVVFVRDVNFNKEGTFKVFHTRMVRPGVTQGGFTELLAGVLPGEVVATKGSGVLRAELLKGNLGAG